VNGAAGGTWGGGEVVRMLAKVLTGAAVGLDCAVVQVEVDLAKGLPNFTVVGLPDAAVQEARDRVRAAVRNSGFPFPMRRPRRRSPSAPP
jgi:magnesium chelatase family protein